MGASGDRGWRIGAVAARSGLTADAIRFYEKQGLVAAPPRTAGGFRLYHQADLERLAFVGRAQALGFSLAEIRGLLLLQGNGGKTCAHVHDLITHKLSVVRQKLEDLRRLESQLEQARTCCDQALATDCAGDCPVLAEIRRERQEAP